MEGAGFSALPSGKIVAYGYRAGEVDLGLMPDHSADCKILALDLRDKMRRPAMANSGFYVVGACPPHPDIRDAYTVAAGVSKRMFRKLPEIDRSLLRRFKTFCKFFIRKKFRQLRPDEILSFEQWLEQTNYSQNRKDELRRVNALITNKFDKKYLKSKCFAKDETYPEYKHARGIYSRSDAFKCLIGPLIKSIEGVVYLDPACIKHVPVAERPKYILEHFRAPKKGVYVYVIEGDDSIFMDENGNIFTNDFSSFEASITEAIDKSTVFELVKHMTALLPNRYEYLRLMFNAMDKQKLLFKDMDAEMDSRRESGDMWTSLGNLLVNMCLIEFCAFEKVGGKPTVEIFRKLGFDAKLVEVPNIASASFCGIIFDPEDKQNVSDPKGIMTSIGWISEKYVNAKENKKLALLRCKALSYAHQYPGCPVVTKLAYKILELTNHIKNYDMIKASFELNNWKRDYFSQALRDMKKLRPVPVGLNSRFLVEQVFGLSVKDQLLIEGRIDSMQLGPFQCPELVDNCHPSWRHYFDRYVVKGPCPDWPRTKDLSIFRDLLVPGALSKRPTRKKL